MKKMNTKIEKNKIQESNIIIDHDFDINKYCGEKNRTKFVVLYLNAVSEHNLLFNNKNVICLDRPLKIKIKDAFIYDLWTRMITGYVHISKAIKAKNNSLYYSIDEYLVQNKNTFEKMAKLNKNAYFVACNKIVRFKYPIKPELLGVCTLNHAKKNKPCRHSAELANELAKQNSKVTPAVLSDSYVVKPLPKNEYYDVKKANEQSMSAKSIENIVVHSHHNL